MSFLSFFASTGDPEQGYWRRFEDITEVRVCLGQKGLRKCDNKNVR